MVLIDEERCYLHLSGSAVLFLAEQSPGGESGV